LVIFSSVGLYGVQINIWNKLISFFLE
jgi:hypothetical protein